MLAYCCLNVGLSANALYQRRVIVILMGIHRTHPDAHETSEEKTVMCCANANAMLRGARDPQLLHGELSSASLMQMQ